MALGECLLQGVQLRCICEALDGIDATPISLHCKHAAGFYGGSIKQYGAATTLTGITANMGAGQIEIFAKKIRQESSRLDGSLVFRTVNSNCDRL